MMHVTGDPSGPPQRAKVYTGDYLVSLGELQRIVEFLNEQIDPVEVIAIEVRQFVGKNVRKSPAVREPAIGCSCMVPMSRKRMRLKCDSLGLAYTVPDDSVHAPALRGENDSAAQERQDFRVEVERQDSRFSHGSPHDHRAGELRRGSKVQHRPFARRGRASVDLHDPRGLPRATGDSVAIERKREAKAERLDKRLLARPAEEESVDLVRKGERGDEVRLGGGEGPAGD